MKSTDPKKDQTVTCIYRGTLVEIPLEVFLIEVFGYKLDTKKFVRYSDGARMFSMSQSEFDRLAHEANAIYKRGKMALVKVETILDYLEYFREFND